MSSASSDAIPAAKSAAKTTLCLALLALAIPLLAAITWANTAFANGTIRYGADRAFAPFEFADAQGRPAGFQIELVRTIGRMAGLDVEIVQREWPAIEAEFKAGRLDVIAMSHTRGRQGWALFLQPHATPAMAIYYRDGSHVPVSMAELAGHPVAVHESEAMRETLAAFFSDPAFRLLAAGSPLEALEAVRNGSASYALTLRAFGDGLVAAGKVPGVKASAFNLRLQAYGFAVQPGAEQLKSRLEQALNQLDQSGELESLRVKWLSSERDAAERQNLEKRISHEERAFGLLTGLGGLLAAALAYGLWKYTRRLRHERQRRRELEQSLNEARERLLRLFTHSPECLLIMARDTLRIVDVNQALCRLLGTPRDALVGHAATAIPQIVDAGVVLSLHSQLDADGAITAVPLKLRRDDGTLLHCLVSSEIFVENGTSFSLSMIRDISAQLCESQEMRSEYESLAESARTRAAGLQARLRESELRLAQADGELQSYTAAVSHDLRSPLRAIMGFSGALREDLKAGLVAEAERHAERIARAARRMDVMLEGLTRLARMGHATLHLVNLDMEKLAREAWDLVIAAEPGKTIRFGIATLPPAHADRGLVMLIWQNLLGNAAKYSARRLDARVGVDSFEEDGRTWYRVTDNGVGFDMHYADKLFNPFQRLHTAEEFAGTGIGLSVVRRVVRRHGGDIRARGSVGVGAVFEFTLTASHAAETRC